MELVATVIGLLVGGARLYNGVPSAIAAVFFLFPWSGLTVSIGPQLELVEFLSLIVLFVGLTIRPTMPVPKWIGLLFMFVAGSFAVAAVNVMDGQTYYLTSPSLFLDGIGRSLVQCLKWAIWLLFICLLYRERRRLDGLHLMRILQGSLVILACLGIVQFIAYMITGIDIFPIGGSEGRSAILGGNLRATSFAGEPKAFASKLAIGIILTIVLRRVGELKARYFYISLSLLATSILLTSSSAGFFSLAGGLAMLFAARLFADPIPRRLILPLGVFLFFCVALLFFSLGYLFDLLEPTFYRSVSGLLDAFVRQTVERIRLDDTDSVYIEFFIENPMRAIVGLGMGLGHTEAMGHIPLHQVRYMFDTTMPPKSGVTEIFVAFGLVGYVIVAIALSYPIRAIMNSHHLREKQKLKLQAFGFALIIISALRIQDMFLILALLAILDFGPATVSRFRRYKIY